jgi:hypothetical protein
VRNRLLHHSREIRARFEAAAVPSRDRKPLLAGCSAGAALLLDTKLAAYNEMPAALADNRRSRL